jgi:hypothetical protein
MRLGDYFGQHWSSRNITDKAKGQGTVFRPKSLKSGFQVLENGSEKKSSPKVTNAKHRTVRKILVGSALRL